MFTSNKELLELHLQDQENAKRIRNVNEAAALESKDKHNEDINNMFTIKESRAIAHNKYLKFKADVKKTLLSECILHVYKQAMGVYQTNAYNESVIKSMVNNFIEEAGTDSLLLKFKGKSYLLSEFYRIVNKYNDIICESVKKDEPETFTIEPETKNDFYDELNMEDIDDAVSVIRVRVTDALDEFINSNVNDKATIKEIIQQSQEKINQSSSEQVKEQYELQAKKQINTIRESRKKNIFESMVINISESAVKNDNLKPIFTKNGKLDIDKIVESCKIMYTFLETVNTCKMIDVDENYIQKNLDALK